jgi:hypothetical protein
MLNVPFLGPFRPSCRSILAVMSTVMTCPCRCQACCKMPQHASASQHNSLHASVVCAAAQHGRLSTFVAGQHLTLWRTLPASDGQ